MKLTCSRILTIIVATTQVFKHAHCLRMNNVTEKSVLYDGGNRQITYLAQGPADGPLMILLHGWPGVAETWKYQLDYFASLGKYVIAPDMPGYGKSTAEKNLEDYAHENIIPGLLALLESTGRTKAIWIGHDWGAGVASSLVATHPEVVEAMAWLAVPYKTLELGYLEVLRFVNRTIYPEDEYPYGQWEYMKYYEEAYQRATSVFDYDIGFTIKEVFYSSGGNSSLIGTRSSLSDVRRNGGWFDGVNQTPSADTVSLNETVLEEDLYEVLLQKLSTTGFGPPDAYYMNHARNKAYNLEQQKNGGYLDIPCLFIEAKYDTVCDTVTSNLLSPMPEHCKNFSFASVDAAHWLALEKPDQTNAVIEAWLAQNVTKWEHGWNDWQVSATMNDG